MSGDLRALTVVVLFRSCLGGGDSVSFDRPRTPVFSPFECPWPFGGVSVLVRSAWLVLLGSCTAIVDASSITTSSSVESNEDTDGSDVHCAELDNSTDVVVSVAVEGAFVEETYCTRT